MAKLVKCKTCGEEIAKTAKLCPKCGAKQKKSNQVLSAIGVLLLVAMIFVVVFALVGGGDDQPTGQAPSGSQDAQQSAPSADSAAVTFSGNSFSAEYKGCSENAAVSGCFYLTLGISNTGDVESIYSLEDVYVDDEHCNTGTGLPVTALGGKNATGSFIVFTDKSLPDVGKVEFRLKVLDGNYNTVETSETITVYPNV